ncbi:hypothetical protein PGT21_018127 [Puccinia graminis f. sp. tritici]|uniref:No apical meristem-associated C-terminal domain-containing protein n=1 Tax=Puccinia graminis f. sp. tritici TaxID=56615 RepID=A0A5B0QB55_PUCGR|nr:hypothetical protein PGT21_018127 [Puccinia graminis f. sp. tritici]
MKKKKIEVQQSDQPSKEKLADKPPKKPKGPIKKKTTVEEENNDEKDSKDTPKRAPNYKDDKDIEICRSWLEITEDPLNSINQSANTFWARVCEHYLLKVPKYNRSLKSVKTCWQTLQCRVNKFNGCYKQVQQANQSGTTIEDRMCAAHKLYAATEDQAFTHMQCFEFWQLDPLVPNRR